jgi:hypothetical protein
MKISDIYIEIAQFVETPVVSFSVSIQMFETRNGRGAYNALIREKVQSKSGVYFWVHKGLDEILYIGMAGSVKTDGRISDHSVRDRLLASRQKDKISGKDVQTNDYVYSVMKSFGMETMEIYVMFTKEGEAPAYIEALAINMFLKKNKCLPLLNKSF